MQHVYKITFWLSVIGFGALSVVHFLTYDDVVLSDQYPLLGLLNIFVFIVWIAVILKLKEKPAFKNEKLDMKSFSPLLLWKSMFEDTPKVVVIAALCIVVYSFVNFAYTLSLQGGIPDVIDGKHVITNRGTLVRELSAAEYIRARAVSERAFTGHPLAFYAIAVAVLWPRVKQN